MVEALKLWWLGMKKRKQRSERERKQAKILLVNGSMLQEQMIGFSNGKSNRIRTFTSVELQQATNAYQFPITEYAQIFKGYFLNIPICVKKCYWVPRYALNNIVFASQMSVHKNVIKLLGVCLETKFPIAVYEWAEHGSLEDCLLMHRTPRGTDSHHHHHQQQQQPPLPWKLRLKIAAEVANVVSYLHTGFSRPIVHRDIKASHILLGQQNVAKLSDFSLCIPIREGEVRVEVDCVPRTLGYFAPEYWCTGSFSEKADVFSFGILLLVLLTVQKSWDCCDDKDVMLLDRVIRSVEDNRLADIVDPSILAEPFAGCAGMNQQLEHFAELALNCAADREEDRPEMIDVEKQLWQMEQSTPNTCCTVISEGMP